MREVQQPQPRSTASARNSKDSQRGSCKARGVSAPAPLRPKTHAGRTREAPVCQLRRSGDSGAAAHMAPPQRAPTTNFGGLPHGLRNGLESLSGFDLSGVRVHRNSAEPAKLDALAFARGQDIHLGPGQEQHLPHEGWHVVQQMQGRVRATTQMKGVGVSDDASLELEADAMGASALRAMPKALEPPRYDAKAARTVQLKSDDRTQKAGNFLSNTERFNLQIATTGRIGMLFTKYSTDLLAVKIEVGRMLKAQRAAANIIFDIALGFLMPGLGRLLSRGAAALAVRLSERLPSIPHRIASELANKKRTKEIFIKATEISRKIANTDFNNKLTSITGNAKFDAYFDALYKSHTIAFRDLIDNLGRNTDKELIVLNLACDPADIEYKTEIESLVLKFRDEVMPIGVRHYYRRERDMPGDIGILMKTSVFRKISWIGGPKRRALALIETAESSSPRFITWISPEMKSLALSTMKSKGWDIQHFHYTELYNFPPISRYLLHSDSLDVSGFRDIIVVEDWDSFPLYQKAEAFLRTLQPAAHPNRDTQLRPRSTSL